MLTNTRTKWAISITTVASMVTLAACSSSSSKPPAGSATTPSSGGATSSSASTDPGVAAATANIQAYLKPSSKIDITTPLSAKPPTGKTVYYIITADPNSAAVTVGFKAAAAALGWTVKVLQWSDPSAVNGLILQAVQANADYIGYIAAPSSLLTSGIAAAKAKNIPIFQSFDATTPEGKTNWIFGNMGGTSAFTLRGTVNADYIISKSNGKANILLENVPAFGVLTTFAQAFKAEIQKNCPGCTYAENNSQYSDVAGGKVPATLVSYIRTHPKVDNVVFTTGSFDAGFAQAAQQAGLKVGVGGIQITSQSLSPGNLTAIQSGQEAASISTSNPYMGWLVMDGMARYSVGDDLTPYWNATPSPLIITKDNATSNTDTGAAPTDYESQFKTLWKLQ